MSSFTNFIKRICKQPAVLWTVTGKDGYGKNTYGNPAQIYVHWEQIAQKRQDNERISVEYRDRIITPQNVNKGDILHKGKLNELPSDADPYKLGLEVQQVRRYASTVPGIKAWEAYL